MARVRPLSPEPSSACCYEAAADLLSASGINCKKYKTDRESRIPHPAHNTEASTDAVIPALTIG